MFEQGGGRGGGTLLSVYDIHCIYTVYIQRGFPFLSVGRRGLCLLHWGSGKRAEVLFVFIWNSKNFPDFLLEVRLLKRVGAVFFLSVIGRAGEAF